MAVTFDTIICNLYLRGIVYIRQVKTLKNNMTIKFGVFVFNPMLKNKVYREILLIVEFILCILINLVF